ncbi:MAG TPA: hypothetical protein VNU45_05525 [Rummeliibacillus sp.]|nr:hypothetical protein [Rummeliibacillus sp.]
MIYFYTMFVLCILQLLQDIMFMVLGISWETSFNKQSLYNAF